MTGKGKRPPTKYNAPCGGGIADGGRIRFVMKLKSQCSGPRQFPRVVVPHKGMMMCHYSINLRLGSDEPCFHPRYQCPASYCALDRQGLSQNREVIP
jgi:hypothetical protein